MLRYGGVGTYLCHRVTRLGLRSGMEGSELTCVIESPGLDCVAVWRGRNLPVS